MKEKMFLEMLTKTLKTAENTVRNAGPQADNPDGAVTDEIDKA